MSLGRREHGLPARRAQLRQMPRPFRDVRIGCNLEMSACGERRALSVPMRSKRLCPPAVWAVWAARFGAVQGSRLRPRRGGLSRCRGSVSEHRVPDLVVAGPFHDASGLLVLLRKLHELQVRVVVVTEEAETVTLATMLEMTVRAPSVTSNVVIATDPDRIPS